MDVLELLGHGAALGILPELQIKSHSVPLRPGETVILYTDGVTEALNEDYDEFGLERLVEAAESHVRAAGCAALDIDVVNLRTELPPFYRRLGFREVGTAPFPAPAKLSQPIHLVLMSKALD